MTAPQEPDKKKSFLLSYADFPLVDEADAVVASEGSVVLEREGEELPHVSSLALEATALAAAPAELELAPAQRRELGLLREALLVSLAEEAALAPAVWEQARGYLATALGRGLLGEPDLLPTLYMLIAAGTPAAPPWPATAALQAGLAVLEFLDQLGASEAEHAVEAVRGLGPYVRAIGELVTTGRATLPDGTELRPGDATGPGVGPGLLLVRAVQRRLG